MSANQGQSDYEDEIDLREILQLIIRRWRWIAATVLLSAAVALGISLLLPKQFTASAAVSLTKPDVVFRFDPRITTEVEAPGGRGIPQLALGDGALQQVLDSPAGETMKPEDRQVDKFREELAANLSDTVLVLTVEDGDAARVAELANVWAEAVAGLLNDLYAPSFRSLELIESQTEVALGRWKSSEQALIKFQAANPEQILEERLAAQKSALASYLDAHRALGLVLLDAGAVQARLEARSPGASADLQDDLAILLITALSVGPVSGSTPLELQVVAQDISLLDESVEQQALYLGDLMVSLEQQRVGLEMEALGLEGEIYALQGRLAQSQEERGRLEQDRDLALEAYQALARKAQETRFVVQDEETVARVASQASVPSEPLGPRGGIIAAIAAAFGLVFGVFWAIASDWWRET